MKAIGIPSIKLTINSNNRQDERKKTIIYRRIKLMNNSNLKHTRVGRIIDTIEGQNGEKKINQLNHILKIRKSLVQ